MFLIQVCVWPHADLRCSPRRVVPLYTNARQNCYIIINICAPDKHISLDFFSHKGDTEGAVPVQRDISSRTGTHF